MSNLTQVGQVLTQVQSEVDAAVDATREQPADAALLDVVINRTRYTRADRDLLRKTLCKDASAEQFELFMRQCQRLQLDPFLRQAHLVVRKGQAAIQIGIDGYRLLAWRSGDYAGNDRPQFVGEGKLAGGKVHPLEASVTVWRIVNGQRQGFTGVALWAEFAPPLDSREAFMWLKMPHNQLAKCAECQALRKGFPGETNGVQGDEDLDGQDDAGDTAKRPATLAQGKRMDELRRSLGMEPHEVAALVRNYGFASAADMTAAAASALIVHLETMQPIHQSEE